MTVIVHITPPAVVGAGDVAHLMGISRNAFARYHRDRVPGARETSTGPIWHEHVARAYALEHKTRKPYLRTLELHLAGAAPSTIAKDINVDVSTVRRYLRQVL